MVTLIVRKNNIEAQTYQVTKHSRKGEFIGIISGEGRNKGTWDTEAKSKRTAQRWAAECRKQDKENIYSVVEVS